MLYFLTNRFLCVFALSLVAGVALSGCNSAPLEGVDSESATAAAAEQESAETAPAPSATPAGGETAEDLGETVEDTLSYEPPFPERLDLFVPPKRERQAARSRNQEGNVELIGFAKVEGREVVLSIIDGSVHSLQEGDIHDGVEIISIKQPAVVLQRGREKWQVSLNN